MALNPRAHEGLTRLGRWAAIPFCPLSPALCLAAIGWLRRRRWGWILGVTIIAIDYDWGGRANLLWRKWKGAMGVAIGRLLLLYVTRPAIKGYSN